MVLLQRMNALFGVMREGFHVSRNMVYMRFPILKKCGYPIKVRSAITKTMFWHKEWSPCHTWRYLLECIVCDAIIPGKFYKENLCFGINPTVLPRINVVFGVHIDRV